MLNHTTRRGLLNGLIQSLIPTSDADEDWHTFVNAQKMEELDQIIKAENLDKEETYKFINNAFRDGFAPSTGVAIAKVLPPISRFSPTGERSKKRETIIDKFKAFFDKFFDISNNKIGK